MAQGQGPGAEGLSGGGPLGPCSRAARVGSVRFGRLPHRRPTSRRNSPWRYLLRPRPRVPDQGPEHPWTARAGRVARDIQAVGTGRAPGVPDQGPEHPWTARAGRVARDIQAVGAGRAPGVPDQGPERPWTARAGRVARDVPAVGAGRAPGVPDQGPERPGVPALPRAGLPARPPGWFPLATATATREGGRDRRGRRGRAASEQAVQRVVSRCT